MTEGTRAREHRERQSEATHQERKERVLTRGTPSVVRSIADAVVIEDGGLFFLCETDGSVPLEGEHGFGLYYRDCRFLSGYELQLGDVHPSSLVATAGEGARAVLQLANPDVRDEDGQLVEKEQIGIRWERTLDGARRELHDTLVFDNYSLRRIRLPVTLSFGAGFEDVYIVRGLLEVDRGEVRPPERVEGGLRFSYLGKDGVHRSTTISCAPGLDEARDARATFHLDLQPASSVELRVSITLEESEEAGPHRPPIAPRRRDQRSIDAATGRAHREWAQRGTRIESASLVLTSLVRRSLTDLGLLRTTLDGHTFFAAGVPWFATLFGRDSAVTALQTLSVDPVIGEETLRVLAAFQSKETDEWRDAEPGKVLHELRVGELARRGVIPHTPYYGTVDATPLFLILLAEHARWTGSTSVFEELREPVELALEWTRKHGDADGDGWIEYQSHSREGLINQGWKDSGDAIVNADGSLAKPPIALVEVQAYAYRARLALADLFRRTGEPRRAEELEREAEDLRARFNREYWLEEEGFYALALQAGNEPARVLSSNPGHALWAGIADDDKAAKTVERLMGADMWSGWGVRTLSERERGYNPIGYHLGTVWPHDNSILAAGFRRYGYDKEALRIFTGMAEAAMGFDHYRLPEVFAGFRREDYGIPVRYPVACHPQAWAAGATPFLLHSCLGLEPDGLDRTLRVVRPVLPGFVERVDLRGLGVAGARVDLGFHRQPDGSARVEVRGVEGDLDVDVQQAGA